MIHKATVTYITANDAPLGVVVSDWLDARQKELGGRRGYGGPIVPGHWLKLTNVTKARRAALVNLV